jgi:hypothetical protein
MSRTIETLFAAALLDRDLPVPPGIVSQGLRERFAVYRNNVMVGLIHALEARFPATRRIVGEDFFAAMARAYAAKNPPTSALMMLYGEDFADFIAGFQPAATVPYLADVARLEAARTRAYHAEDAMPLLPDALASLEPEALPGLKFSLHPSLQIVASKFPIVTIWAMNAGETALAAIEDWQGEDALILRPRLDVEVRRLPPGGKIFLENLASGLPLKRAAEAALQQCPSFNLSLNLAGLLEGGLIIALRRT